jgi:hypothetical protein
MNKELTSGIAETEQASLRPAPKVRIVDGLVTVAILICVAAYAGIGLCWLLGRFLP